METGLFTGYIDLAQILLYLFWVFFVGLILYIRREDKREGYPLENDRSDRVRVVGFPDLPEPITRLMPHGRGTRVQPSGSGDDRPVPGTPAQPHAGAPLIPTGNPMGDCIGPGSWADRPHEPDLTYEGEPRIVPMRSVSGYSVAEGDPDPRGMDVVGADGKVGGKVVDLWVDRGEPHIRYLELDVPVQAAPAAAGEGAGGAPVPSTRRVLLPTNFSRISGAEGKVKVASILGRQFVDVPGLDNPDQITLLEEDKICAYYGAGTLYATPQRQEPLF